MAGNYDKETAILLRKWQNFNKDNDSVQEHTKHVHYTHTEIQAFYRHFPGVSGSMSGVNKKLRYRRETARQLRTYT